MPSKAGRCGATLVTALKKPLEQDPKHLLATTRWVLVRLVQRCCCSACEWNPSQAAPACMPGQGWGFSVHVEAQASTSQMLDFRCPVNHHSVLSEVRRPCTVGAGKPQQAPTHSQGGSNLTLQGQEVDPLCASHSA